LTVDGVDSNSDINVQKMIKIKHFLISLFTFKKLLLMLSFNAEYLSFRTKKIRLEGVSKMGENKKQFNG
jgi:hypothetical protein